MTNRSLRMINGGYLLGIILLLAAAVYFFASNWQALGRGEKIGISVLLMAVLYGASLLAGRGGRREFLSKSLFVGGCAAFGISVALLGQIYNSHADSYGLFAVWFVPAFLYSLITRYEPFYVMAYILGHLGLVLYVQALEPFAAKFEDVWLGIGFAVFVMNAVLFVLTERELFRSRILRHLSFWAAHLSLLFLSNSFIFEDTYGVFLGLAVAALIVSFFYLKNGSARKSLLGSAGVLASVFAIEKFLEIAAHREFSMDFFLWGILFFVLLLFGNVQFVRFLNRTEPATEVGEAGKPADVGSSGIVQVLTTLVMVVGVAIGAVSIVGVVSLATGWSHSPYVLVVAGTIGTLAMTLYENSNRLVRFTILYTCALISFAGMLWSNYGLTTVVVLIGLTVAWLMLKGRSHSMFLYVLMNVTVAVLIYNLSNEFVFERIGIVALLVVANAIVFALGWMTGRSKRIRQTFTEPGLTACLGWFFILTFMHTHSLAFYAAYNLAFFAAVTFLVFFFQRTGHRFLYFVSLWFWIGFLFYKYYDYVWSLLHKSVSLAVIGLLFVAAAYVLERKSGIPQEKGVCFLHRKKLLLTLVFLLQLGFLAYQIVSSEEILAHGKIVKLELAPRDPRYILQGDYIALNYRIAHPNAAAPKEQAGQKVRVALTPDQNGVYIFQRYLAPGEKPREGEVLLVGKQGYGGIEYGIETYFVPEGTGTELSRNAKFAQVRVGRSGNGMLVGLSSE